MTDYTLQFQYFKEQLAKEKDNPNNASILALREEEVLTETRGIRDCGADVPSLMFGLQLAVMALFELNKIADKAEAMKLAITYITSTQGMLTALATELTEEA